MTGALLALLLAAQAAPGVPEAHDVFQQRQQALVALAGELGALHRLNQVCAGRYGDEMVFRERMMEVVDGESPPRGTREAMISAFNERFRSMSARHVTCSRAAEEDFRREALIAMDLTDRLSRPLGAR